MHTRNFVVSVFILLVNLYVSGQENSKEIYIRYPIGSSTVDTTYGDNAARLREVVSFLENIKNDSTLELREVSFCGSASPDGAILTNKKLAAKRCESMEQYVRGKASIPDSLISRCEGFIAWERLAQLVEESDMTDKAETVDMLRNIPEFTYDSRGVLVDSRKKHLMELQYGRTWNYMFRHFFSQVRYASVIFVTVRQNLKSEKEPVEETPVMILPADTIRVIEITDTIMPVTEKAGTFYMAGKTNMLYDILAVPNIGVEFYIGTSWSVSGNWMYGWWNNNSKHRYWRIYGGDISIRKWLGKKADTKPLTGHHIGIYGQIFTYDFEWGGKGYMGGKPGGTLWDKMNYAAGVEYGYSLPIARRLNIDFTIGLGYWGGKYYKYIPLDGHYVWQATKNRNWFGPTKAEISLVWLLGNGFNNDKKGGVK